LDDKKYLLECRSIIKDFIGVRALDNVNFNIRTGEVLAIVGENGAGKSTLIKTLSGVYKQSAGEIFLSGNRIEFNSPKHAIDCGISVMYQELNNIDQISIAENIFLGNLPLKKFTKIVDYKKLIKDSKIYLEKVGLKIHPLTEMSKLCVAEKQLVEIAKAISKKINLIIMDEPTTALNDIEVKELFRNINLLLKNGKSVIYVSHKLDEVFEIADRIQVLRDGKTVGILGKSQTSKDEIVSLMVGRKISDMYPKGEVKIGEYVLEINNLKTEKIDNVNLKLKRGEILGLFGLMGAGMTEIVESIFGITKKTGGIIKIDGKEVVINNTDNAKKNGIGYVPPDRKKDGLILIHSIKNNITLTIIDKIKKFFVINLKKEKEIAEKFVSELNIKTYSVEQLVMHLSGGNQQKVVLSKWLATNPRILILNEPTRGIDVGAKVEVYKLMEGFCKKGFGIIMISPEIEEIMAMSDRLLIVRNFQIVREIDRKDFSQELITSLLF